MELDGDDLTGDKSSKDVRKNIPIKLKSRSRGRPRKVSKTSKPAKKKESVPEEKKEHEVTPGDEDPLEEFSTMKVTGEEPMHKTQKLKWDHKVNLIGIKVVDPIIHTCSTCLLPILIYGRMIPCKHVFCFDCAKKTEKVCTRCNDPVNRVEQSALGAVFVCNYGGSKHGVSGCRRTYLSQRDLQAHINYRHLKEQTEPQPKQGPPPTQAPPPALPTPQVPTPQVAITSPGPVQAYSMPMTSPPIVQSMQMATSQPPPQQPALDHGMMYHQQSQQQGPPQHPPPLHRPMGDGLAHNAPLQQPPLQHPAPAPMHQTMAPPPVLGVGGVHQSHPPPLSQGVMPQTRVPPPVTSHMDTFHNIPVMSSRSSNLITVPIQDESDYSRHDQPQYQQGPAASQPLQFHHPPPTQNMMSAPPPTQHYNTGSHNHGSGPMMNPPPFSTTGHMPPPQGMITSHPPPIGGPRPLNVNLSQPPPNTPMGPRQVPPPQQGPPMGNRYPNPPRQSYDNKPNMYNQPPPNNPRTWQGGPPPQAPGPMGSGPPPCGPNNANNMAPPPTRPFYQ